MKLKKDKALLANPKKALERELAKKVKIDEEIQEIENDLKTIKKLTKIEKQRKTELSEAIAEDQIIIDNNLSQADFIIEKVRDVCYNAY